MMAPRQWLRDGWQRVERPLADGLFAVLLIAAAIALGWLAARHDRYWDWTAARGNTLSPETVKILERVKAPLRATVFIGAADPLGKSIDQLLARYRQLIPGMEVRFVDPQLFPEQARGAHVSLAGQILLEYRGRRETLSEIGERGVSGAIARLSSTQAPWLAVVDGHGERRIAGEAPADLGRFGLELKDRGFLVRNLDLATVADVPVNTHLVLVSTPAIALFPGEAERLGQYLDRGGNLLLLLDPGAQNGLEVLTEQLGISLLPGTVVDAKAADFGVDTPAVAVISEYPDDPLASGLKTPALLPGAVAFDTRVAPGWTLAGFLSTGKDSWNETGRLQGQIARDEVVGELAGPLPVVLALTRPLGEDGRVQRVLVVGDGDFLSNAQLGAAGNRALALKLMRWLSGEDGLLPLPPLPQTAEALTLSPNRRLLLGIGTLGLLPAFFIVVGLTVRWSRARG
jgi:hypothetical protein